MGITFCDFGQPARPGPVSSTKRTFGTSRAARRWSAAPRSSSLRLGTAKAEQVLRRLTRGGPEHPAYRALEELGRTVRTPPVPCGLTDRAGGRRPQRRLLRRGAKPRTRSTTR
ncbi:Tn3 family transposase [Streptomyces stramineus]|uniref:Tn3 family transposase n=1 Tax=Streptomyces TaxID=1883 RepID=UPI0033EBB4CC